MTKGQLLANGNEYALSFSVNFSPVNLAFLGAELGGSAADCSLFVNTNQIASGRVGFQIIKPWPSTFAQFFRLVHP